MKKNVKKVKLEKLNIESFKTTILKNVLGGSVLDDPPSSR